MKTEEKLKDQVDQYEKFFGHCQGLCDLYDENKIDTFGVVLRLRELCAIYEEVLKALK